MPGSNGYSIDPALMGQDPIGSQLSYEEDTDNNQEFYFLLNNLQKQAGRKLKPEQINALTQQWNNNQNGYQDKFRQMVQSKMGLQNTVNTQELARNKMQLDANRIGEGMGNVAKVDLLSTVRNRQPKLEDFKKPIQNPAEDFKTKYWLSRAQQTNPNFKSIDDIKAWQQQNGLVADGKFGDNSLAKWNELNSKPQPIEKVQKERANGRLTVDIPEEMYTRTAKNPLSNSQEKGSETPTSVEAVINRTAARFPGGGGYSATGNNNGKAFFGLADSDALVNLAGDAWDAAKGFMSKVGDYLSGPDKPIQTNTPTYGRRNLIMEGMQKAHSTFGNTDPKNAPIPGTYGGGKMGGGGAGSTFYTTPEYEEIQEKERLLVPITQTWNRDQAFAQARKEGKKTFWFDGKEYTTEMGNKPASAAIHTETKTVGILPIEYNKKRKILKEENK